MGRPDANTEQASPPARVSTEERQEVQLLLAQIREHQLRAAVVQEKLSGKLELLRVRYNVPEGAGLEPESGTFITR